MNVARAITACALWMALGCNGTLRFDESAADAAPEAPADSSPRDAGTDEVPDVVTDAAPCTDDALTCGWRLAECGSQGDDDCELHCLSGKACSGGTCGTGCVAECQDNSSCTIAAGDVARVECEPGASCSFTLGSGSNAACSSGSNCRVQCDSRCAITCHSGATCQLRCGTDASTMVTGTASCP